MAINYIILEDEPIYLDNIKTDFIAALKRPDEFLLLFESKSYDGFNNFIETSNEQINLAFIDEKVDGGKGSSLIEKLHNRNENIKIVLFSKEITDEDKNFHTSNPIYSIIYINKRLSLTDNINTFGQFINKYFPLEKYDTFSFKYSGDIKTPSAVKDFKYADIIFYGNLGWFSDLFLKNRNNLEQITSDKLLLTNTRVDYIIKVIKGNITKEASASYKVLITANGHFYLSMGNIVSYPNPIEVLNNAKEVNVTLIQNQKGKKPGFVYNPLNIKERKDNRFNFISETTLTFISAANKTDFKVIYTSDDVFPKLLNS